MMTDGQYLSVFFCEHPFYSFGPIINRGERFD